MRKTNNPKLSATCDKNKQVLETLFSTPASGNGNELTLLELIERIVVSLKIDDNKDGKEQGATEVYEIEPYVCQLAERLGFTSRQALLFSLCVEMGNQGVSVNKLAEKLGLNAVRALTLGSDIAELNKRRQIKYTDKDKDTVFIPAPVINALKNNETYVAPRRKGLNCLQLFETIDTLFEEFDDDYLSIDELKEDLGTLLKDNKQLEFVRQVDKLGLGDEDRLILLFICHKFVNQNDDRLMVREIVQIFPSRGKRTQLDFMLHDGKHPLFNLKLIEHVCNGGMANTSLVTLTDEAKVQLLAELNIIPQKPMMRDVVKAEALSAKNMFYSPGNQHQVEELHSFFQQDKYLQIRQRMLQRGFRSGFACLFYGSPGTGKTETVYQLARQTGRDIMVVDVPSIKSKWVGESEKNIKALFERYRQLVKKSQNTPILLFNEADAIIGTRMSGAESAVDKMENSIQNIILQEMENLDGIMIATTNLEGNLDPAFERRFLYKIMFEKPDTAIRGKIWQEMIPELTEEEAQDLAASFDFSGGQIENVSRKHNINSILHGDSDHLLPVLREYCENERLGGLAQRRIGF